MIDIDTIEEQHFEQFCCKCQDDRDLENLVWEHFANGMEQFLYWKEDQWSEEPEQRAFDALYQWDGEWLHSDPLSCLEAYLEAKDEN